MLGVTKGSRGVLEDVECGCGLAVDFDLLADGEVAVGRVGDPDTVVVCNPIAAAWSQGFGCSIMSVDPAAGAAAPVSGSGVTHWPSLRVSQEGLR